VTLLTPRGVRAARALAPLALVSLAALGACGRRRPATPPQVGVALLLEQTALSRELQDGLRHAAESLGLGLRGLGDAEHDPASLAPIERLIAQRVDAIVLGSTGADVLTAAIQRANRAAIPVFTVDAVAAEGQVVTQVVSDDRQGGRLLGTYVGRRLHGGGNVAILDQPAVPRIRDRVAGFREALDAYPNIRIVAAPMVDRCARDAATRTMEHLLATDQRIDAVFATSDDCALGALAAIRGAARTDIVVVGYDADPEARAAIVQGTALVADAAPDPRMIGRRVMEAVAATLHGQTGPARVAVPVRLVDRDSLAAR